MLEIVSEAVKSMAEGELLQLQKSRKLNIKEEDYYKIMGWDLKTGKPYRKTLVDLDLADVADDLWR